MKTDRVVEVRGTCKGGEKMPKCRKIPQRTCIGCRTVRPKKELIRIVRTPEGEIHIDPSGKRSGRGAYVCPQESCIEKAFKRKQLEKALETGIGPQDIERLLEEVKHVS